MNKVIYEKFDKDEITQLPQVLFNGKVEVVTTEVDTEKAVSYLLKSRILGIDTETRPVFSKGQSNKVSLLQVSTFDVCFLFRLNILGLNEHLIKLLTNTSVPMVGLSLHDDILALHKRKDFSTGTFIDLQNYVGQLGIKDMSLRKLYANIFHEKISKRQRLSNWDAEVLTDKQQRYAATDAWACIMLYEEIKRLIDTQDYELKVVEPTLVENK
jgi:ribonuclease D